MKIMIIGFSGSGKSTLAKQLANFYDLPLLYLDSVNYLENWVQRDREEGLKIVEEFLTTNNNGWVIDGNYIRWCFEQRSLEADKIIFLNFNRFNCLFRAYKRYKQYKNKTRESITKNCNEKFDFEFIKWILYEGRKKSRTIKFKEIKSIYKDKTIEIKNQKQLDNFKNSIIK